MRREAITAPKLYAMLYREFRHVRNPACANCRMPLPFYRAPADEYTANWHIGTPRRCERGCHLKIAEVVARLWTRYDLKLAVERRGKVREIRTYDEPVVHRHFARTGRTYTSHTRIRGA